MLEPKDYDAISSRAVGLIGREAALRLLPEQTNTLDRFLGELLEKKGSPEAVTDEEIVGQIKLMHYFMPTDLVRIKK